MSSSNNNNSQDLNIFSYNQNINNFPITQPNINSNITNNYENKPNNNHQRVENYNINQDGPYYSNQNFSLNNTLTHLPQNQVGNTNEFIPYYENINYNGYNQKIIPNHNGFKPAQFNDYNNLQISNNNNSINNNNGNQLNSNAGTNSNYINKSFNNRPIERLPYYNESDLENKNKTYLRYIDSTKYNGYYECKLIPQFKYIINRECIENQLNQKHEDLYQKMLKKNKDERNKLENIHPQLSQPSQLPEFPQLPHPSPPPEPPEKKEKYINDKVNGVMEDMCIYGNFTKNEIIKEKQINPKKFIPTKVALNSEKNDQGLFALALIASDLKNKGIETAIINDNEIVDKKLKQEAKDSAITCLQFMANGLIFKKKYDFHFDLDNNRVNEIINNENEYERFKENLKEKLHKDFNIPKDKIIITFPQIGSLIVQVIIQSDEFNHLKTNDFLEKFKNDRNFSELKTLKKVHEGFLMSGCILSRLLLDPLGNRSEWPQKIENRGGEPYYPPYGWIGIGLKVLNQYMDDRWLDMQNQEGEWVVAYHGLGRAMNPGGVNSIIDSILRMGFKIGRNQVHANCDDFYHKGKKVGEGIYCTPYINVAGEYAGTANVNGANYKIVIMVRVNPSARRHCNTCEESKNCKYWVVNATVDEIRPYRILYKKCE